MASCPSCGHENGAEARFCSACGAALAAESGREARKTVTVLFADVTGSTALGERLDPESFRRVMARYFDEVPVVARAPRRDGREVHRRRGDGRLRHPDAARGRRPAGPACGVEMRDALASLNDELERDFGVSPRRLRIGVNTGEVVTGTQERLATGDAVNVAARLEQAAEPGEILLGERDAPARARQRSRSSRSRRSRSRGSPSRCRGAPPAAGRRGRAGVRATARRAARRPAARSSPACATPFDASVASAALPASSRCSARPGSASHASPARSPSTSGTRRPSSPAAACPTARASRTGRCVEIFREAGAEDELERALAAGAPEEIFWSVRKALERRARERPLVLVVEDIHWAEPTLLDLIEHLADWTRDAPLFLLCLARPELLDERPAWGSGESITLEPLAGERSRRADREPARRRRNSRTRRAPAFARWPRETRSSSSSCSPCWPRAATRVACPRRSRRCSRRASTRCPTTSATSLERASVVGLEFEWEALGAAAPDRRRPSGSPARCARPQGADPPARGDRGHVPLPAHADPRRRVRAHPEGAALGAARALRGLARRHGARSSTRSSATTSSRPTAASLSSGRRATERGARASGRRSGLPRRAGGRTPAATPAAANLLERALALHPTGRRRPPRAHAVARANSPRRRPDGGRRGPARRGG